MNSDEKNGLGWISLHRRIKEHWLWKSEKRLKWWLDILLSANHSDNKVLIKGQLIECKRGQVIKSLDTWARDWNVSKGAVRKFLLVLGGESMIDIENVKISTRITICNYDKYQGGVNAEKTQNERRKNAESTQTIMNNNDNNENKLEKRATEFQNEIYSEENKRLYRSDTLNNFFNFWSEPNPSRTKMRFELEKTWDLGRRLTTWASREPELNHGKTDLKKSNRIYIEKREG